MSLYKAEITAIGGGGGGFLRGGGGGGDVENCFCLFNAPELNVCIGKGGYGYKKCDNNCNYGLSGEYTCILYTNNTPFLYAKGGCGAWSCNGGESGNKPNYGGTGRDSGICVAGGGGAGAGGSGSSAASCYKGGNGGCGKCGYGGGGGGAGYCGCGCKGLGCDGGGDGAYSGAKNGCDGVNGGGGGGGFCNCMGGNGGDGLVIICYKTDGSYGINCATGGTKTTSGDYTIHTFTSSGTFTIVS